METATTPFRNTASACARRSLALFPTIRRRSFAGVSTPSGRKVARDDTRRGRVHVHAESGLQRARRLEVGHRGRHVVVFRDVVVVVF